MADSPNTPNQPGQKGKKELGMEARLILAFVLMGLVLFVTPYFYKPPQGPKGKTPATPAEVAKAAKTPPPAALPAVPAPAPAKAAAAAPAPPPVAAAKEQEFVIDTDLYRIRLSNRGAVVRSWLLKKFTDNAGKPLELVNEAALATVPAPFSIWTKDNKLASALNGALFEAKPAPGGLGIDYVYSDGQTVCRKSFRFTKDSYLSQVTTEVDRNGEAVPHLIQWRGGFGDNTLPNRQSAQHSVLYDVGQSKLITKDAKAAKNGMLTSTGDYSFAGLDDTFFAFVALPKKNGATEVLTIKDDLTAPASGKQEQYVGAAVGGDSENQFSVFVGPKDVDILKRVDPRLQQIIDWGWFGIIAKPLFVAMRYMNDNFLHNYGWSIVLVTIVINVLILPLRFSSMKSAKKMQALQPQIAAINAKYKKVKLNDPRKAEQNQEVMALYKKHGANPLGGCLPMVIQIPLIYAFYKVLAVTIEMRGAHWLWVADLSQPEQLPLHILPIVMIVTQFFMQKMTPNPTMDQSQAKMMMFMPLMLGFFFYNLSSGLVLYYLTSNLVGIAQQYFINRYTPAPVVEASAPVPVQKKVKR